MSRLNRPNLTRHQQRPRFIPKPNSNSNTNDPTNIIYVQNIATQVTPNTWIINKDVTIGSDQNFGNDRNNILITFYNFTNNGKFENGGKFYTLFNFINNGTIINNDANFFNTGNLVFNRNDDRDKVVFNRGGNIINTGTYTATGIVVGNQVQNMSNPA